METGEKEKNWTERHLMSTIVEGATYVYTADWPKGCQGKRYKVLFFVLDVPVYAEQVCVEALEGPDAGLRFTCSPQNFATRYELVEEPGDASGAVERLSPAQVNKTLRRSSLARMCLRERKEEEDESE